MHLLRPGSGLVIRTQTRQIGIAAMKTQTSGGKIAVFLRPVQIFPIQAFLFVTQVNRIALDEKLLHLSRSFEGSPSVTIKSAHLPPLFSIKIDLADLSDDANQRSGKSWRIRRLWTRGTRPQATPTRFDRIARWPDR